jgi:formylmethanofuran dehydrogenase subunit E
VIKRISLKEAINFHGHLGPYLVLGLLAGEAALKMLGCRKYFKLNVLVYGATEKPKSCFIDGIQLSTGATYGKGNIKKLKSHFLSAKFVNLDNKRRVILKFKNDLISKLKLSSTHKECEALALKLYKNHYSKLFSLKLEK